MRIKDIAILNPVYSGADLENESVSFSPMECLRYDRLKTYSIPFSQAKGKYTYFGNYDVLFAKVTPCFENLNTAIAQNLLNGVGFGSSEINVLRLKENVSPRYIFYLVCSKRFIDNGCASMCGVGGLKRVSPRAVNTFEFSLPSPEEQEAIAAYLDKECERIGREIELLERKADAYTRLRRSIINRAVTRGLNPNAPLKLSGIPWIGSIPAHWDIKRGKSLFQEIYRDVRPEDGTVTCFRDGEVTLRTNRRTTGFTESEKEIGYHGVRVGDLVIHQMDAFAGSIGISDSDGKCSPICIVCRPLNEDEVDLGYYCQLLRVMAHSGFIQSLAKGIRERTTDFRYKTLVTLNFPVPPYIEQQHIAAYLDDKCGKIDAIIEKISTIIERLKELKRSLINEVVTGQRAINYN